MMTLRERKTKSVLVVMITVLLILLLVILFFHKIYNEYNDSLSVEHEFLRYSSLDVPESAITATEIFNSYEGWQGEGKALYQISLDDTHLGDEDRLSFSVEWNNLPFHNNDRSYLEYFELEDRFSDIQKGKYKIIDSGNSEIMWHNTVLIVYDEAAQAFYLFKNDS